MYVLFVKCLHILRLVLMAFMGFVAGLWLLVVA